MNSYASISQLLCLSYIGNEAADRRNIESAIEALLARLAAVEAERDAAQKRVQDCETRMMRYAIELAEMQAERDAARAGEARAVEALWKYRSAQRRMLDKWADGDAAVKTELWRGLHECEKLADGVLDQAQPALDWLAQQRREAAAEALESVRIGWLTENDYGLGVDEIWRYIADRAAALRAGEVGNE